MLYFPFNIAYYCYLILCRNTDVQMQFRKQKNNFYHFINNHMQAKK